jgi:hypothetical protein
MKIQHGKWLATTLIAGLWLTGCGGGGGGGSSTTTASDVGYAGTTEAVAMTDQASADAVAADTIASAISMDLSGDIPLSYKSGSSTSSVPGLAGFTQQMIDRALALPTSSTLAGAIQTQTVQCSITGTITYTANVADPNASQPSAGDSVTMSASSCDEGFGSVLNGSFSMTVLSFSSTGMSVNVAFSHFTTTAASGDYSLLNGGFAMALNVDPNTNATTYSMIGDALLVEQSTGGVVKQQALSPFSLVDTIDASWNFTADHDYTFYSTNIGGGVTVTTTTPIFIFYGDYYPSSGVVVITGAGGASVRVTAIDNTLVQIDYDLDADGEYGDTDADDPASQTKNWYQL